MATKKVIKKTPKPAAKPAVKPVVKKTTAKAAVKAIAPKTAILKEVAPVETPIVATPCCGGCGCKKRAFKKLLLLIVVFALGFATCCFTCCGKGGHKFGGRAHYAEFFTNGCLDTSKIQCPEKAAKITEVAATADVDNDGCVTPAEFRDAGKALRHK